MKTISIVSRKGGSGKTTVAVQLALSLHRRGYGVVVADIDPQRSSFEVLKNATDERLQVIPSTGGKLASLQAACARTSTDVLVIDTPAVLQDELASAIGVSDLALLVVRPSFLDLSAAVATGQVIRQLSRPGMVLINQAPAPRQGVEAPLVVRALRAASLLGLEVCQIVLRTRACYQQYLEGALSAEAVSSNPAANDEVAALCALVEGRLFPTAHPAAAVL
jgi:chromosome partitioning protein